MTVPKTDFCSHLTNRTIIEIQGADREAFLQGIITQDTKRLEEEYILYSLMLSPQGKFQFDFFIIWNGDSWLIDIDATRAHAFVQRLQLFKLHSDVSININNDWQIGVSSTQAAVKNCFFDPRLKELGYRFYDKKIASEMPSDVYENMLLSLGIPDGAHDMVVDKSIPLEWGMDELNAIAWNKGCYMGQELTARSRYVGQIRKRTFPITFKVPGEYTVGEKLMVDDREVGELRATNGHVGIALLKLEALKSEIIISGHFIKVSKPSWMQLPE
jgi:folate-binding protein YgfZ